MSFFIEVQKDLLLKIQRSSRFDGLLIEDAKFIRDYEVYSYKTPSSSLEDPKVFS